MPGQLGRNNLSLVLWGGVFVLSTVVALAVGGSPDWGAVFGLGSDNPVAFALFWKIRVPRVVTALAVGGGLAVVGAVLQSLLRNPLADPFLLGISSASAFGAVLALAAGWPDLRFAVSVGIALLALIFLDRLAFRKGVFSDHHLLIAGVAITYLFAALTGLVIAMADAQKTRGLIFWIMGGFSDLDNLATLLCVVTLLVIAAYLLSKSHQLDVLASGDESAHVLGVRPASLRRRLFFVCSMMVGLTVATAGGIGFVGVLVPHTARLFCGVSHRQVLVLSLLGGGALTVFSDTIARSVFSPREIPVGLITALIGAPFFLHYLSSGRSR